MLSRWEKYDIVEPFRGLGTEDPSWLLEWRGPLEGSAFKAGRCRSSKLEISSLAEATQRHARDNLQGPHGAATVV